MPTALRWLKFSRGWAPTIGFWSAVAFCVDAVIWGGANGLLWLIVAMLWLILGRE